MKFTIGEQKMGRVSHAAFMAAFIGLAATPAMAAEKSKARQLPTVTVEASDKSDYKVKESASPKFTAPLLNTPQTVTVVPKKVIEDQGATSLRDVLRNVSGISLSAGEGGTPNGDNLSIRGYNARTDIFIDGQRDIGGYFRDSFNLEQVEVVKGPSSAYSGRGGTGGSINLITKAPALQQARSADVSVGTDDLRRIAADVNQPLDIGIEGAAVRLNFMAHDSDVAGRDVVENSRWGFAPSLAFGLGTPTRINLDYTHITEENIPDYGLPYVSGAPANVDYSNFYGLALRDYEDIYADIGTIRVEHDFNDGLTLRNQTRYGNVSRDSLVTPPRLLSLPARTVTRESRARDTVDTILNNQTDLTSRFATGDFTHTLVTGIELSRETSKSHGLTVPSGPVANLDNPNPYDPFVTPATNTANTETDATAIGVYAFDTMKINEQWEVNGGLRWDQFDADFDNNTTRTGFDRTDRNLSGRAGLVYKPAQNGSVYVAYGTSFNPSAESLTLTAATANLDPETSESYEIGTKWELLDAKLNVTSALFRTNKTNARTTDPIGAVTVLEGEQRVDGIELGATGQLTPEWQVFGGYTFMTSEVERSRVAAEVGKEVAQVPDHSFTLWTTYQLPEGWEVGGGGQYIGRRYSNNSNTNRVDGYWRFDATTAYQINDSVNARVNLYNLTDEEYIESVGGGHAVPGAGRTVMLTTGVKF